jgi:tetratricopeptide (TPR) repeat protein
MTQTNSTASAQWSAKQTTILATFCLLVGVAGGWAIHAAQSPAAIGSAQATQVSPTVAPQPPTPAQLKQMADAQAAPLLERLRTDAQNPAVLAAIGNTYYDAQQYSVAVDYYRRTLQITPADADVRTDMGTAYWFQGNADSAIAEFDKALTYAPNNPNTLFNRGLVKWRGKKDGAGALADWNKLLAANPAYDKKTEVDKMIAEVKNQPAAGTK